MAVAITSTLAKDWWCGSVPILMLTAMGQEADKVAGLEAGADDYLAKPFGALELLARVKALLRRSQMESAGRGWLSGGQGVLPSRLAAAGLEVDLVTRRACRGGNPLRLAPKEFDLLAFLMCHRGQAFSQRQLLEQVWGYQDSSDSRTVVVHIRWLREKLEADPSRPQLIETVKSSGYRFRIP